MSITTEITRLNGIKNSLQTDRTDITNALINRGVTVPSGSGFDNFAGLIRQTTRTYSENITLLEDQSAISFTTAFEPKFVFFTTRANWSSMKNYLEDVSGKEVRQVYYCYWCAANYLFNNTDAPLFFTQAFQKSNDGIYNPVGSSSIVTTESGGVYTTTISRTDTSAATWRFAGNTSPSINYNVVVLG